MKNAIICHGSGSSPESFWFPNIKVFLEDKGYQVWVPQLPDADQPDLRKWLHFVLNNGEFNSETIMIGHSSGCPLILSILEKSNTIIDKIVLVSGYARVRGGQQEREAILQIKYDWNKIKNMVRSIVFINSNDDPWGCNHEEGLYMWNNLGGTLVLRTGEGHMGSDHFKQPYKDFPLLKKILEI